MTCSVDPHLGWEAHKGSLMRLPKCGAMTKRRTCCQRVAVKGVGRCQLHGGGKALLDRYRAELLLRRGPTRREWLLKRLSRSARNAETQFLKGGRWVEEAAEKGGPLGARMAEAIGAGQCDRGTIARWMGAVDAVRPYRLEVAQVAVYEALLGEYGIALMGADAVAGALSLDSRDRERFFACLGLRAGLLAANPIGLGAV